MADKITKEQLDLLKDAEFFNTLEYHELLKEYAGIVAEPYTAYLYYDSAGNYLGGSEYSTVRDLLSMAYVEVEENATD